MSADFDLERDAFGQLVLTLADGRRHAGVSVVRAFPLSAPGEHIAVVGSDGHELAWIAHLDAVPPGLRALIEDELKQREFMPVIRRLLNVSSVVTPSQWQVDTDRGQTRFTLKSEDDIRRLGDGSLLIADSHGVHYRIPDLQALDRHSRRLLDRFL